jgi:ATP/maltotriose-dependent transcriptional regulator MalT
LPEPAQLGLAHGAWLACLKREYKNLLAALHFFQEQQEHARAFHLAAGMGGIWFVNGYGSEGLAEMARALALLQESQFSLSPDLHALALALAAGIAIYHGDFQRAKDWYWDCLHLCKQAGNSALLSLATAGITLVETDLGNYPAVATLLDEAIADLRQQGTSEVLPRLLVVAGQVRLHRGLSAQAQADAEASIQLARAMPGQEWSLACALSLSGWVEYLNGSWTTAHAFGQESIAILRQLGFPVFALEALCLFAHETAALGDLETARTLFEEALFLSQEADDPAEIARALCGLGYLALRGEKLAEARHLFEESLATMQQLRRLVARFAYIPASSLEGLAAVASVEGKAYNAALLLGAAYTLRQQCAYGNRLGQERAFWKHTRRLVKKALGEATFAAAFATGERLTPLQAASAQALDQQVHLVTPANADPISGRLPFGQHLTKREMDVLRLLAQGLSNAQIAEKLVLSVVTVNTYLRSVYSKLEVSSRTAAIRYVWDNHLF